MERLGGIAAKKGKKKNQPENLVLVSRGKKIDYYVWICLNKGRDGLVTLTKPAIDLK